MSFVFDNKGKYLHTTYNCVKCYGFVRTEVCECHSRGERVCKCPVIRHCKSCDPSTPKQQFIHSPKGWRAATNSRCECGIVFTHIIASPAYVYRCPKCPPDYVHNTVQKVKETPDYVIYRVINNMYYDPIVHKHFPRNGPPRGLITKSDCTCD